MAVSYSDRSLQRVDTLSSFRWSAIFAGLFAALACQVLLSAVGAAIGISASAVTESPDAARGLGVGAGIWMILSPLISMFVGGTVAAWLARPRDRSVALLHGGLVWCLSLVIGTFFLGSLASGALGGLATTAGNTASGIATGATDKDNRDDLRAEVKEKRADAEKDVKATVNDPGVRDAANTAANVGTGVAWAGVFAMLLSLGSAILGAGAAHKRIYDSPRRPIDRDDTPVRDAHIVSPSDAEIRSTTPSRPLDTEYRTDLH